MNNLNDAKATELANMAVVTRDQSLALQVNTTYDYEQVSQFRKDIKAKFNEIEGYRVHLKEPYLEGCKRVDDFFRPPLLALKEAETQAKTRLIGYETVQKQQAALEQQRLEAEARKKREALEHKARLEREKAELEAAELRRQEAAARQGEDLHRAVELKHEADVILQKAEAKAENAEAKAAQVTAPTIEAYIPPVAGQHTKTIWKARVIDANLVPNEYKVVDESMLNKFAQATKGKVPVPGVEIYSEQVMSGRAS